MSTVPSGRRTRFPRGLARAAFMLIAAACFLSYPRQLLAVDRDHLLQVAKSRANLLRTIDIEFQRRSLPTETLVNAGDAFSGEPREEQVHVLLERDPRDGSREKVRYDIYNPQGAWLRTQSFDGERSYDHQARSATTDGLIVQEGKAPAFLEPRYYPLHLFDRVHASIDLVTLLEREDTRIEEIDGRLVLSGKLGAAGIRSFKAVLDPAHGYRMTASQTFLREKLHASTAITEFEERTVDGQIVSLPVSATTHLYDDSHENNPLLLSEEFRISRLDVNKPMTAEAFVPQLREGRNTRIYDKDRIVSVVDGSGRGQSATHLSTGLDEIGAEVVKKTDPSTAPVPGPLDGPPPPAKIRPTPSP